MPRRLAVLALLVACAPSTTPAPQEAAPAPAVEVADQPDLLLVLVGGLRSPLPEGPGASAALLEAAAAREPRLSYSSMYAQSVVPWLSLGSALTGRYVASLPLCTKPKRLDGPLPFCTELPRWAPTMGEVLGLYGYRTGLVVVDQPELAALGRGFDLVHAPRDADPSQGWTGWTSGVAAARSFWTDPDPRPKLLVVVGLLNDTGFQHKEWSRHDADPPSAAEQDALFVRHPDLQGRLPPGRSFPLARPEVVETGRRFYVAGARWVGEQLAPLLGEVGDEDWLFVGGLHGVSLGETHGSHSPEQLVVGTSQVLLDRTLRTPLWVWGPVPEGLPASVEAPVEVLDLLPTVAGLAGAVPPAQLPGRDLLHSAADPDPHRAVYAEYGDMLALRKGRHLVVFRPQQHGITSASPEITEMLEGALPTGASPVPGGGRSEDLDDFWRLHEVGRDPAQADALPLGAEAGPFPPAARALWQHRTGPAAPPVARLSAEELQTLRQKGALHYW